MCKNMNVKKNKNLYAAAWLTLFILLNFIHIYVKNTLIFNLLLNRVRGRKNFSFIQINSKLK